MKRKNDALWKGILEEVFEDMLRFVFPDVDQELDLKKGIVFLDKELLEIYPEPQTPSKTRHVDKLAKVFMKDGKECWLLVHIEVQDSNKSPFAKRMFTYYYRVLDHFDQPVTAIAIFSGRSGKSMPDRYENECLGTHLVYQYNTLHLTKYSDEVLEKDENPFALVLLAAKKALLTGRNIDKILLQEKLLLVRLLIKKGLFSKPKIKAIFSFLNNYIVFEHPETKINFVKELDIITGKNNTMGIIEQVAEMRAKESLREGRREGRREGLLEGEKKSKLLFVERLLKEFDLDDRQIAHLTDSSIDSVKKVRNRLQTSLPVTGS